MGCALSGFRLNPDSVHLEIRDDRQGHHTGTGVAYVQFVSTEDAEQARQTKHKQMMGTRYIECMIFIPGMLSCVLMASCCLADDGLECIESATLRSGRHCFSMSMLLMTCTILLYLFEPMQLVHIAASKTACTIMENLQLLSHVLDSVPFSWSENAWL